MFGHAFVHGTPPPFAPAVLVGEDARHPELTRIVDCGLDAQDRDLLIDLDPVLGHPVLDPPPLGSSGVGDHLGGQRERQLAV
jgi:hypothetical protein